MKNPGEILRSKRLAALTTIITLGAGALAAGCGSSSSSSPNRAKPSGATAGHTESTPPEPTTTAATPPPESASSNIDIHKNLCGTVVDSSVRSQYTYTSFTCENTYTVHGGGAEWTLSINPTEAAHATVDETAYDSSAQAQASFAEYSSLYGGGTSAGAINGMECTWIPNVKSSDTTGPATSYLMCLGGSVEVDFDQQDPTASLDHSKQVMRLVLQTASQ